MFRIVYLSSPSPGVHLKAFTAGKCDLSFGAPVLPYACFIAMRRPKENLQFSAVTPEHRKRPFYPGTPPFQQNLRASKYYPLETSIIRSKSRVKFSETNFFFLQIINKTFQLYNRRISEYHHINAILN